MNMNQNDKSTRSANSLRNAKFGAIFYILILITTFFFRRYFIQALGVDLLGITATVQNILGFLNVAELGLASAVVFALYKPLFESNRQQVIDIVSIQGWFYRYIAIFVSIGSVVLAFFFPLIFNKTKLPLWYVYSTYGVMLYGTLLSYLFNYRQVIFTADQKDYKVAIAVQLPKLLKMILQTLVLFLNVKGAYILWLVLEVVGSTASTFLLEYFLKKTYPWLKAKVKNGALKRKEYPIIMRKTGQLIFHRISAFILFQFSPLLLYFYTDAEMVAIYTNYIIITNGIVAIIDTPFRGITGSVGNLVASEKHERVEEIFRRLFLFRLWGVFIVALVMFVVVNQFVGLWVGPSLVLPVIPMVLWLTYTCIAAMRLQDVFVSAYGLYQDIWAPIVEMSSNLLLSVCLGYFYGLSGILIGSIVSVFSIPFVWRLFFLYHQGFGKRVFPFFMEISAFILVNAGVFIFSLYAYSFIVGHYQVLTDLSVKSFVENFFIIAGIGTVITFIVNYLLFKDFRVFMLKMISRFTAK